MKKFIFILVVLALLGGGGWWWWENRGADDVTYQTAPVARGDLVQTVTATGTLNPVLNVQVGSQISGNIQKLNADFNSVVKANDVVAEIDPSVYQAVVAQAEGDVANAKAALELAQLNAQRTEELRKENVAPQSVLDQAIATLHQAEAMVKMKEGVQAKAQTDLDHCKIYSPIDGIVISRLVDVGQTVAASLSAPVIFQIAHNLANMQIDTNVAEADIGNIAEGQDVEFTVDAHPYRTFRGKVRLIRNAPITVQNVVTYDTVIDVDNADLKLKPGMTANVSVIIEKRESALKLSNSTLRFRPPDAPAPTASLVAMPSKPPPVSKLKGEKKPRPEPPRMERTIYVLRGEGPEAKPEAVKIKTGISDGIFTEILEGLQEGDPVVVAMVQRQAQSAAATTPFRRTF
ncbi:MAG TPA: efflux RND transporter periplasmic adaptor subunit [Verrucomicrobiaceae bacterium]